MTTRLHAPAVVKFLREQKRLRTAGCWQWPKFKDKDGYGRTKLNGKTTVASRVAYQLSGGVIPAGLFVLHKCDNPSCIRPSHLFLGTQKDNYEDAKKKDRHSRGERNGQSKLTVDDIVEIRKYKLSQNDLADKYGVRQSLIWRIIHMEAWRHV